MLFKTVYGPELASIFYYIQNQNHRQVYPSKEMLTKAFVPQLSLDQLQSSQSVEDALSFLSSIKLIDYCQEGRLSTTILLPTIPFRLLVLMRIQLIMTGQMTAEHPLDPLYGQILSELFVSLDKTYIDNLHKEVNNDVMVKTHGGLSKEKIQTWRRVMQYLGVGVRIQNGFLCSFTPDLVHQIVSSWEKEEGTFQEFIEEHFSKFTPCTNRNGEISKCASTALLWLHEHGQINLFPLQDSPSRFYFFERKIRGLKTNRRVK